MESANQIEDDNQTSAKDTLISALIGIFILGALECSLGVFISQDIVSYVCGVMLGSAGAVVFYVHLYITLGKALELNEQEAVRYFKIRTVIRMVLMGLVIVIAFTFYERINVIMAFIGLMNVKFSAYIQPLTDKYILKNIKKVKKC